MRKQLFVRIDMRGCLMLIRTIGLKINIMPNVWHGARSIIGRTVYATRHLNSGGRSSGVDAADFEFVTPCLTIDRRRRRDPLLRRSGVSERVDVMGDPLRRC